MYFLGFKSDALSATDLQHDIITLLFGYHLTPLPPAFEKCDWMVARKIRYFRVVQVPPCLGG